MRVRQTMRTIHKETSMKKVSIAQAMASLVVCATAASAQTLTVFGVVDVNLRHIDNGGERQTLMSTDGNFPSRLGFRGVEDLGGGLSASFWLESGINIATGALVNPNKFFHRRSTLSLSSTAWGELRLGRDYTPTFMAYALYDPFFSAGVGAAFNVLAGPGFSNGSGAQTTVRADTTVQYLSPANWGGWNAQLMHTPGDPAIGQSYQGGRVGYAHQGFSAAASYGETDVATGSYSIATLGGSQQMGAWKLSVAGLRTAHGDRREHVKWVGVSYRTGQGEWRASLVDKQASGGGTSGNDARQLALGYVHDLSKRTAVYSTVSRIHNRGASASVVAIGSSVAGGRSSTGVEIGLRHTF